jgi:hypothetical protein
MKSTNNQKKRRLNMQTKNKKSPFQIVHWFIASVKQTHRSEIALKSCNMRFNDDELVIISHLEQAATDLRCANPELIEQAKQILAKSPYVPESAGFKQCLLALIELLLIEAKVRQKNLALYDFLYNDGELWYFHNRDRLPNEVVIEIDHYLTYDGFYLSPEETQKKEEFEEPIAHFMKQPSSVEKFIREKIQQMPDYKRNDFVFSKRVRHWIEKWYAEYCAVAVKKHVSIRSFENRVSELRKEERKRVYQERGIEEEELKKALKANGRIGI